MVFSSLILLEEQLQACAFLQFSLRSFLLPPPPRSPRMIKRMGESRQSPLIGSLHRRIRKISLLLADDTIFFPFASQKRAASALLPEQKEQLKVSCLIQLACLRNVL